jgi:hypothetical protein
VRLLFVLRREVGLPLGAGQRTAIAQISVGASRGTGFLVHRNGYVLTALHCVALAPFAPDKTPVWRREPIRLRFGDPRNPGSGPLDAHGALVTRTAVVAAYSVHHDVALLKLSDPIAVEPLELGPGAFGIREWSTFGFPDTSGVLAGGCANDVMGQDLTGKTAALADRIQLTLDQLPVGNTTYSGISGAPIMLGTRVVGVVLDEPQRDGAVVQNTLYGVHIEALAPPRDGQPSPLTPVLDETPPLPWQRKVVGEEHVTAALAPLPPERMRLAAQFLGLSEEPVGIHARTTVGLLTRAITTAVGAFVQYLMDYCQPPPPRQSLGLIFCGARIPEHVVQTAAPALDVEAAGSTRTLHVGGSELATRALAFRFAAERHGLDVGQRLLVSLGSLAGVENASDLAAERFERALIEELAPAEGKARQAKFEKAKGARERQNWPVYVIAEVGSPPDLVDTLSAVYKHVRVLVRGPARLEPDGDTTGIVVPECVSRDMESAFEDLWTLFELE